MVLDGLDGLFPSRRLWCPLLVRCRRLTGYVLSPGVAAPAVLPVPFSTGFASGLTWDSRVRTVFALASFLSDFAQFPVVLPPVLLPFRLLTSGSLVFLALFGCLRKFWCKGCLCLCSRVPLFFENPARIFLRSCLLGLGLSVSVFLFLGYPMFLGARLAPSLAWSRRFSTVFLAESELLVFPISRLGVEPYSFLDFRELASFLFVLLGGAAPFLRA